MRMITLDATALEGRNVEPYTVMINIAHIEAIIPGDKQKGTKVLLGNKVYTVRQDCPKILALIKACEDF